MSASPICWQTPGLPDRLIRLLTSPPPGPDSAADPPEAIPLEQFLALDRRPPGSVIVGLGPGQAFFQTFDGRSGAPGDLRKIVANTVHRLTPLKEESEVILARQAAPRSGRIELTHIRNATVDEIEQKSRSLGLADLSVVVTGCHAPWSLPAQLATRRREGRLMLLSLTLLAASLFVLTSGAQGWVDRAVLAAQSHEAVLHKAVMARDAAARETGALGRIASSEPEWLTPAGRLAKLAELSSRMPDSAWLASVEINGHAVRISGYAQNAAATLSALSGAYPDYTVRFDQPVSPRADGTQAFAIILEPRNP